MADAALHIVFTDAGAETLREALRLAGRADEVVALLDDFSLGPIAATANRTAWYERELGAADWREYDAVRAGFWLAALDSGRRRVAWWSWRWAQEYCGFLELISRLGDGPCDAVDLSEAPIQRPGQGGAPSSPGVTQTLAFLTPGAILRNGLLDRVEPLAAERRADLLDLWSRLRTENAPLRVPTGGGGLVSAPLSFFDDALLRHTPREWWPTARTVAEILGAFAFETRIYQTGDTLLVARIRALAAAGRIELRGGDLREGMSGTEIRLAGHVAAAPPP